MIGALIVERRLNHTNDETRAKLDKIASDNSFPKDISSQLFTHLCTTENLLDLVQKLNSFTFPAECIQSVHIHLYNADKNSHILFYPDGASTNTAILDHLDINKPNHSIQLTEKYKVYEKTLFNMLFPSLSNLSNYTNATTMYHFPLSAFNCYIGKLEVVSQSLPSDKLVSYLKQASIVVSLILAKIFDGNLNHNHSDNSTLSGYSKSLKLDDEIQSSTHTSAILSAEKIFHNHVLVDVTETVIGQVDFEGLSTLLFSHLHEHLNIELISILSLESESETLCCHEVTQDTSANIKYKTSKKAKKNTVANKVIESKRAMILGPEDYPLLNNEFSYLDNYYETNQLNSVCVLPLVFRQKVLGVIKYGHKTDNYFSEERLKLLQQIAARIAVAINNFQHKSKLIARSDQDNEGLFSEDHQTYEMFGDIISQSAVMTEVLQRVLMVADCDSTVLILGETGTGKEMIAEMIHSASHRSSKKMVTMNCSAVPHGLFESDLFGHEKGAFTGAVSQQKGRFEEAHKSSFFLDEIGDMPLDLQPKVLRALQESEIERVGKHTVIPVDVRLIAATHCDLLEMVKDKTFRQDLYYRLNVFPIYLPPLRERREDIPLLAKHFTKIFSKKMKRDIKTIPSETLRVLTSLPWPGNIRELKNVIERAVVMTHGPVLHLPISELREYFPEQQHGSFNNNEAPLESGSSYSCTGSSNIDAPKTQYNVNTKKTLLPVDAKKSIEREQILQVLRDTNGIVAGPRGAAQQLGLKRTTLLSRMQRLDITSKDYA